MCSVCVSDMRTPTQSEVRDWIIEQGMTYPQFAAELGCKTQTVRGWMASNKPKPMREQHLVAAGRLMRDKARNTRGMSRTLADLAPQEWAKLAEIAHDYGQSLPEFMVETLRESLEAHTRAQELADAPLLSMSGQPTSAQLRAAGIKAKENAKDGDETDVAWADGYAAALDAVAKLQ